MYLPSILTQIVETTHTPQGDGNGVESILVAQDQRETTHTPQGDGNL